MRIHNEEGQKFWICCASAICRSNEIVYSIKSGTSTATSHLRSSHAIESLKTAAENENKRRREDVVGAIIDSDLFKRDLKRYGAVVLCCVAL